MQARLVENYYVVPVIQVPKELFAEFPPLTLPDTNDEYWPCGEYSLILSCLGVLLDEASRELLLPDPGRSINSSMRSANEIVAHGAEAFMRIPDMLTAQERYATIGLFQRLNIISSLLYEGAQGTGSLILVRPNHPDVDYLVRFQTPVPFHESRWARKILAMAGPEISLIASGGKIFGLGRLKPHHDPPSSTPSRSTFWSTTSGSSGTTNYLCSTAAIANHACHNRLSVRSAFRATSLGHSGMRAPRMRLGFGNSSETGATLPTEACWSLRKMRHLSQLDSRIKAPRSGPFS